MKTVRWVVLGVLILLGTNDLFAALCVSKKSMFSVFFLQWPGSGCAKSSTTITAVNDVWKKYDPYDRWGASATAQVTNISTYPAPVNLHYMEANLYERGIIYVNTHGFETEQGGSGIPCYEYYDSDVKGALRWIRYTSDSIATAEGFRVFPEDQLIWTQKGTDPEDAFSGLFVGPPLLGNRFSGSDPDGLWFAGWSYSEQMESYLTAGVTVFEEQSAACTVHDYWARDFFNLLGCCCNKSNRLITAFGRGDLYGFGVSPNIHVTPYTGAANWRVSCKVDCEDGKGKFELVGAFDTVVWARMSHWTTKRLRIKGYRSMTQPAESGEVLRVLVPSEPTMARNLLIAEDVGRPDLPIMRWVEEDESGCLSYSRPFQVEARPEWWTELSASSSTRPGVQKLGVGDACIAAEEILSPPPPQPPPPPPNPYRGCDVVVYGTHSSWVLAERATLETLGWEVRTFVGNGTIVDQQAVAESAYTGNHNYNTWCAMHPFQCSRGYPSRPTIALVGVTWELPGPVTPPPPGYVIVDSFPDTHNRCREPCRDMGKGAEIGLDSSPVEDLPVYYVPSGDTLKIERLRTSALRWEASNNPHARAAIVVEDLYGPVDSTNATREDPAAIDAMREIDAAFESCGIPAWSFTESAYDSLHTIGDAFLTFINVGAAVVAGTGGVTSPDRWSAGVASGSSWWSNATTPQTMIAIMPGCDTADNFGLLYDGLFRNPAFTTLAFATGHADGGYQLQHYLWAEVLGLQIRDAAVGTAWPRIVWDAKMRALAQYPFLEEYLRSVRSIGTMVRKLHPLVSAIEVPQGGLTFDLRVVGFLGDQPTFQFSLPKPDEVTLAVYDARGRLVARILAASVDQGRHELTWNGRDSSGRVVGSGVYFARLFTASNRFASTKVVLVRR